MELLVGLTAVQEKWKHLKLKTMIPRIWYLLLVCIWTESRSSATSYHFTKFGTPIVLPDRIVFAGPGWEPHRLICIDKKEGKKIWECTEKTRTIRPAFLLNKKLLVTVGSDIFTCDPNSGRLALIYQTGYSNCSLAIQEQQFVLISGDREDIDLLSYVDSSVWRKMWEVPRIRNVVAETKGVLLCQEATRQRVNGGGYTLSNQRLAAVSRKDGRILWRQSAGSETYPTGVALSNYFVVYLGGQLFCYQQADGRVLGQLKLHDSPFVSASLACRNGQLMVWTQKGRDVFSGHVVYEVSVPQLTKRELAETDWYSAESFVYGDIIIGTTIGRMDAYHLPTKTKIWQGGQWNWEGVHDGNIYFSTQEPDGKTTTINRIEVKTGKRIKLYEEALPSTTR